MGRWFWGITCMLLCANGAAGQAADPMDTTHLPRLTLTRLAEVGGGDLREDYLFEKVRDVVVLGPDAFAVLDSRRREVLKYGTDGNFRARSGGEGEGPGEFQAPRRLSVLPENRLLVWDSDLRRTTIFGPSGQVESTSTVTLHPMARFFTSFIAGLPDGSWIQRVGRNPQELKNEPEGARRDSVVFRHVAADGTLLGPITSVLGPHRILVKYSDISRTPERPILGRDLVSAVQGDTLLFAHTDSLLLMRFKVDGTPLTPLRLPRPVRPAGSQMANAIRTEMVAKATSNGTSLPGMSHQARVAALQKMPAEETIPAFAGMLLGADGTIWVREYRPPGEVQAELWFRMGDDFRPDGWFDLPDGDRLLAAGHGLVLSLAKDQLDLESIVVYRIDP